MLWSFFRCIGLRRDIRGNDYLCGMESTADKILDLLSQSEDEKIRDRAERIKIVAEAAKDLTERVIPSLGDNPRAMDDWVERLRQRAADYKNKRRAMIFQSGGAFAHSSCVDDSANIEGGEFVINPRT